MSVARWLGAVTVASAAAAPVLAQGSHLVPGQTAPDFTLEAASRTGVAKAPVRLSALKGRTVVLAFFYKARTKG